MNKTILAFIFSAAFTSSWWAWGTFELLSETPFTVIPFVLSVGMIVWVIVETCNTLDKYDN